MARPWNRATSSASVMPWARAARTSGVSRSTMRRRLPGGVTALSCASRAAPTAPQLSWLRTTTSGTSSTAAPYSTLARTSGPTQVSRGPDDEEVAETAIEDDLRGDPGVRAAEEHGEGPLRFALARAPGGVLVRVVGLTGDEARLPSSR